MIKMMFEVNHIEKLLSLNPLRIKPTVKNPEKLIKRNRWFIQNKYFSFFSSVVDDLFNVLITYWNFSILIVVTSLTSFFSFTPVSRHYFKVLDKNHKNAVKFHGSP
jgi:hypothetical protein